MFVLDTMVLSEARKNPAHPSVVDWLSRHETETLFTTAVNIYEIRRGILDIPARDTRQSEIMSRWLLRTLDAFAGRILPLDAESAVAAAEANKRTNVELKDCMIGAIADAHGMVVVSRNERHLSRTARQVINPWPD